MSKCLTITWEELENLEPPAIAVEGESVFNKTVDINTPQTLTTDRAAIIYYYEDDVCSVGETAGDEEVYEHNSETPAIVSFRAKWNGFPNAPVSDCLTITWVDDAPTSGPEISINGQSENITLPVDGWAKVTTDQETLVQTYTDAMCTDAATQFPPDQAEFTSDWPNVISVQSYWVDYPEAPRSKCLTITWTDVSVPTPTLTLNGQASDVTVESGEKITFVTEDSATLYVFDSLDCSGIAHQQSSGFAPTLIGPTWYSAMAVHNEDPTATSECFVASWNAPVPTLTLNDQAGDITVDSGETVTFATEDFATLQVFESLDCTGAASAEVESGYAPALDGPTALSVRAIHNQDPTATSDCYVANWNAPVVKETLIRVEMWDGSNLEGAPWSLYAPVAMQDAGPAPIETGTLDANNSAMLTDALPGEYEFVVEPDGLESQRFSITIGDESEEIVLRIQQPEDPVETPSPTVEPTVEPTLEPTVEPTKESTPTATDVPATEAPGTESTAESEPGVVTGLPETGSGTGSTSLITALASILAISLIAVSMIHRRDKA